MAIKIKLPITNQPVVEASPNGTQVFTVPWYRFFGDLLGLAVESSGVETIVAGDGIAVDSTDVAHPIVSATGVESVTAGTGIAVNNTDPQNPIVSSTSVLSVVAGSGVTVDSTDPLHPIVSAAGGGSTSSVTSTVKYQGSGTSFNYNGFQALQPDTSGGGVVAATRVPGGTQGQSMARILCNSTVGAGFGVDFYSSGNSYYRALSGTGTDGFTLDVVIMPEAITDAHMVFFGICEVNSPIFFLVTQISDLTNFACIGKDSTDVGLQFMTRDTGVVTKVPLGIDPGTLVNQLLRFQLESTGSSMTYTLTNLETNTVIASGSQTATLPTIDTKLFPHFALMNSQSGGAYIDVKLSFIQLEMTVPT